MQGRTRLGLLSIVGSLVVLPAGCNQPDATDPAFGRKDSVTAETAAARVNEVADRYYDLALERSPFLPYFRGLEVERHDRLADYSPEAIAQSEREDDALLESLGAIELEVLVGHPEWITYGVLSETLEANKALRICRTELWSVNQMWGWQLSTGHVARMQPVGTPELREQALSRWKALPGFIDQQIENLERGVHAGYSSPKPVVERVLAQIDGLLDLPVEESPFFSAAARDDDEAFSEALAAVVDEQIGPALQRYRDFLESEYLHRARDELSVTTNPDGRACYEAMLGYYTTLDRSPEEVFELGSQTVAANRAEVVELGAKSYGLDDFGAIVEKVKANSEDRFDSKAQLLDFSREVVSAAGNRMPDWVGRMPSREVVVEPYPEYEDGTGVFARYEAGSPERPGTYRISLYEPTEQSIGRAELVAFHEAWPGHHLQISLGQEVEGMHRIMQIAGFSSFSEGWARYSERLAEEMGLFTTTAGRILRRTWPARGMVADPGLHVMGWSRQQAIDFLNESGTFTPREVEDMVDRIAIIPGQLTAYDSGALEIFALRAQAETELGEAFHLKEFHDRVLEIGNVPLALLRAHIEAWLAEQSTAD